MKTLNISLILLFLSATVMAQNSSFPDFLKNVLNNNPYALKANFIESKADMEMRLARGAFDPKLQADFQQKQFENTEYYSIGDARLSVPTFIGLKAEAGFQQNDGTYLNNQNLVPANGLAYLGLSMPVLQGLRTDEARTAWQIADIRQKISANQWQWAINELLYKASAAYIEYAAMTAELSVLNEGIINSRSRLDFVRNSFTAGDKAAIDTTEALLQIQVWEAEKTELMRNIAIASQQLNILEWSDPQSLSASLNSRLDSTYQYFESKIISWNSDSVNIAEHPRVDISKAKIDEAILKRKLAAESLKPQLDLKYNFLRDASNLNTGSEIGNNFNSRDYNWGLNFGFPLLLRKERAKIQLARIGEREAELDFEFTLRETLTYINAAKEALFQSQQNAARNTAVVQSYEQLYLAEQEKFNVGESSLFILNTRESKWIESKRKLIKSKSEVVKAAVIMLYSKGGEDWLELIP